MMHQSQVQYDTFNGTQILLELNSYLCPHGVSVSNLREEIQDGVLLLTLLAMANIQGASNFHQHKKGSRLTNHQIGENCHILSKILNDHARAYGYRAHFNHSDVLAIRAPEAVSLVIHILDQKNGRSSNPGMRMQSNGPTYQHSGSMPSVASLVPQKPGVSTVGQSPFSASSVYANPVTVSSSNPDYEGGFSNATHWNRVKNDRVVRIFLSSAFVDMKQEREFFYEHGEPRLQEWAKKKGLCIDVIDFHRGQVSEVQNNGQVLIHSYECIERCPYFVGLLGPHYGWIPNHDNPAEWHPEVEKRYPCLSGYGNLSLPHYEIKYSTLLENPFTRRAIFYERHENSDMDKNQVIMKQEVRQKHQLRQYQTAEQLVEMIVNDFIYLLEVDFRDVQPVRVKEDLTQEQFIIHKLDDLVERKDILFGLIQNVRIQLDHESSKIAIISAEAGMGKSSMMAALIQEFQQEKSIQVIHHFVGGSKLGRDVGSINKRIYRLLFECHALENPPDSKKGEEIIKKGLFSILQKTSTKSSFRAIIFLDDIDLVIDSKEYPQANRLDWLPKALPRNIAIVASTSDALWINQSVYGLDIHTLSCLSGEVIQVAEKYLGKYNQPLKEAQKHLLLGLLPETGHPLFLRMILDEMRSVNFSENADKELEYLTSTRSVIPLFNLMLSRWENMYNSIRYDSQPHMAFQLVRVVTSVLKISRIGLSDAELDSYITLRFGRALVGEEIGAWRSFFFKLTDSLYVQGGRYAFRHQLLEEAVQERYLSNPEVEKEEIKFYVLWLRSRCDDLGSLDEDLVAEMCRFLCATMQYSELGCFLSEKNVKEIMIEDSYKVELDHWYRVLGQNGFEYQKHHAITSSMRKISGSNRDIKEKKSTSERNPQIHEKREIDASIKSQIAAGDKFMMEGQYQNALKFHLSALDALIENRGEEHTSVADSYDIISRIYNHQERYEKALKSIQKSLKIREKLVGEHHPTMATLHNNMAVIYKTLGLYSESVNHFQKSLEIMRNTHSEGHLDVATLCNNIAIVLRKQKRYEDATKFSEKSLEIRERIYPGGLHHDVGNSYYNKAYLFEKQKKYSDACEWFKKAKDIFAEIDGEQHPRTQHVKKQIKIMEKKKEADSTSSSKTTTDSTNIVANTNH